MTDISGQHSLSLGYNHHTESFAATADTPVARYGERQSEHLTPQSLIDSLDNDGIVLTQNQIEALDTLADKVRDTVGDYSIVGVNSRLFTVSPNNNVTELRSDGYHSPDGFSWGYDGNGPRQSARAILEVTQGRAVATDHTTVDQYAQDVLATIPSQHSHFEIRGQHAPSAVPHINLSSPRIDTVISQLNTIDLRTQPRPDPPPTPTPHADSSLLFSYRPQSHTYAATATPNDPSKPSTSYGYEPASTPTPESLLAKLGADGHRPEPAQLQDLADLQTQVRERHGEHTIIGHTSHADGQRHLHLITPNNEAHGIEPTGSHSPDGYNWGYHGSGTNETAERIADTVLGSNHPDRPQLTSALRESLANITTNNFTLNASDAAKPGHPLDITPRPHLGMEHVKSIGAANPSRPAPTVAPPGPTLGIRI